MYSYSFLIHGIFDIWTLLNEFQYLEAVDARRIYPKDHTCWREDPSKFNVNGVYPLRQVWEAANTAWKEILFTPVRKRSIIYGIIYEEPTKLLCFYYIGNLFIETNL